MPDSRGNYCCKNSDRRRSRSIAEAEYVDDDGVLVSIELNVDEKDDKPLLDMETVFEPQMDVWENILQGSRRDGLKFVRNYRRK
jgi:hypothetical protein